MINKITSRVLPDFIRILGNEDLCTEDINLEAHLYFVVQENDSLVGGYGLEIYGTDALLRSVVLQENFRGKGHGRKMIEHAKETAFKNRIRNLYLLTTTASDFFNHHGFNKINRNSVPEAIGNTVEFKTFCPDSAICMTFNLKDYARK